MSFHAFHIICDRTAVSFDKHKSNLYIVANGDTIHTTVVGYGKAVPGIPGLNRIVEINTITGGTGPFTNAQGSFLVERLVDLNTGLTSGSLRNT